MARALKVHPAAILIAALIAANLLGLLGVVIAAPFLASVTLLGKYTMRKLFDLDPWPDTDVAPIPPLGAEWLKRIGKFLPAFAPGKGSIESMDTGDLISAPEPSERTKEYLKKGNHTLRKVVNPATTQTRISRKSSKRLRKDKKDTQEEQNHGQ